MPEVDNVQASELNENNTTYCARFGGSHSGVDDDSGLLGYDAVSLSFPTLRGAYHFLSPGIEGSVKNGSLNA